MITPSSMNGDTPLQLPAVPGAETSLDDLAVFIDTQYDLAMVEADAAMAKATDTLRRALVVGAALIEAKSRLKHGEWGPWLQENTHVPARTARKWMRLAHNRTELSNRPLTADLGIEEALKL